MDPQGKNLATVVRALQEMAESYGTAVLAVHRVSGAGMTGQIAIGPFPLETTTTAN
jgi:hypothetical protein